MSRVAQFLAGVTVVAAATANVDCSAGGGTNCSSCVGTGIAKACASFQAPSAPTCVGCGGLTGAGLCSVAASPTASCSVCVSVLGNALAATNIGVCIQTTANVAAYLSANSTLSAGIDISNFANGVTLVQGNVSASSSLTVPPGNNIVILPAIATIASVNADTTTTSSSAIFQNNASLAVGAWNNAGTAQVNNNNNAALQIGQLAVGANSNSDFMLSQDSGSSVTFQSVNFGSGASLQIAGGAAHFGGSATASSNITGSGTLQLSNGVSVDGNIPANVMISVDGSGTNAPLVSIDSSTALVVNNDVLLSHNGYTTSATSANTNAVIAVNGGFTVGSTTSRVQPKVVLNSGASFLINTTAVFTADAVTIGANSAVIINANVDRANLKIQQIAQCAGKIQIHLAVTGDAFIASSASMTSGSATGSVAFSYASTNDVNELVKCGVEVYDVNNKQYTLTSRTAAQASAGRRLLASDGSATWGQDSMTFQMQKQTSAAPVTFAVIPLLMVSMAGLLF